MVSVMRKQPSLRAATADTGEAKKNHACAPLPERDRSMATGTSCRLQVSAKAAMSSCQVFLSLRAASGVRVFAEWKLNACLTTAPSTSPRIVRAASTIASSPEIMITQDDLRAIQLAKAALYAGARLLMDNLGVDTVDEVRLAGAFGSHIDPMHAMVLGLIPDCDLAHVSSIGNAAGTGALAALLARDKRDEAEAVVRDVEKVETAVEPRFQAHFVEALAIPHRTAPPTFLSQAVALPQRRPFDAGNRDGRRRTRRPTPTEPAAVPEEI